jgi:hypothetical protein
MSTSSDWTYESVIGSSSAVGGASMKVWRMGRENVVEAERMKRFRSSGGV